MMKGVWTLVVLYSGPFGLAVYWYAGRTQIRTDSLWRRGFRSTAHCYSGCGAGEVLGSVSLHRAARPPEYAPRRCRNVRVRVPVRLGPDGRPTDAGGRRLRGGDVRRPLQRDTQHHHHGITAIGTDLLIASQAHITDLLFWGALVFSLSVGFDFAFPVNATLVHFGVEEGMKNPAEMGQRRTKGQAQTTDY